MYARNMLVQPGPLSAPRTERSMDTPSFRIIDFGRYWSDERHKGFAGGCEEDERRAKLELLLAEEPVRFRSAPLHRCHWHWYY